MQNKVLVTGADGFIGSHLVEELVAHGYEVTALTLYNAFQHNGWLDSLSPKVLASVDLFRGDVRDYHCVAQAMQGCATVFHLAALIGIPYSYTAPASYVDTNVTGTLHILEAARHQANVRVLLTSTSEVYGSAQFTPITEDHPLTAQSPYAATKIGADALGAAYARSFDLPVTLVRPFNTYGPRQSPRAIIPAIILQLLAGQSQIQLGALHPTRDLVFVKDTARAFRLIAESPYSGHAVLNVATQQAISMGELAAMLIDQINPEAQVVQDPDRLRPQASEVVALLGANNQLRKTLNWTPETPLAKGLSETVAWFRDNGSNLTNASHYHV